MYENRGQIRNEGDSPACAPESGCGTQMRKQALKRVPSASGWYTYSTTKSYNLHTNVHGVILQRTGATNIAMTTLSVPFLFSLHYEQTFRQAITAS